MFTERGWRAQVSEGSFCRKSRQLCGLLVSYGRVACLIWEGLRMCVGKKSHQGNSTISCKQTGDEDDGEDGSGNGSGSMLGSF